MKKLLLALSASLLLVGAGCAAQTNTQTDVSAGLPAIDDEQDYPAPSEGTAAGADTGVNLDADLPGGIDVGAHAELSADVSIMAGGTFSPVVITVTPGTTVTWRNTGGAKMVVASDPHPTHNGYVGFDSKSEIAAGESYSFTFDKKGSWGYHNHLNPTVKGTVIVE